MVIRLVNETELNVKRIAETYSKNGMGGDYMGAVTPSLEITLINAGGRSRIEKFIYT